MCCFSASWPIRASPPPNMPHFSASSAASRAGARSLRPMQRTSALPMRHGRTRRPTARWHRATSPGAARSIVSLFVDAMAPTNTINGNPAALKKLVDTGGASLRQGMENFARDLASNGGLPAQVDGRKFAVGENLATTPGAVVYRSPVMELIQYRPLGDQVFGRPLLIAPPQINKFYVFDLTPEKSIIRFALAGDLQTFAISWKNPTPAEGHFGLDTYVAALEEAVDVIRDITGSEDVNIWGSCSGGI